MANVKEKMEERVERLNQILRIQGSKLRIAYIENFKNNSLQNAYSLVEKGKSYGSVIYYEASWFEKSDVEVVDILTKIYYDSISYVSDSDILAELNSNYIYKNVYAKFIPSEKIRLAKEKQIHLVKWMDLGVSFYVELDDLLNHKDQDMSSSLQVTKSFLEYYKIEENTLLEEAIKNMEKRKYIFPMNQPEIKDCHMIVITNKQMINGAATVMLPSVLEELKEIFENNFVILPSSVHECIVVNMDNSDPRTSLMSLAEMVHDINVTHVREKDYLSDNIYYFCDSEMHVYDRRCSA